MKTKQRVLLAVIAVVVVLWTIGLFVEPDSQSSTWYEYLQ